MLLQVGKGADSKLLKVSTNDTHSLKLAIMSIKRYTVKFLN